MSERLLKCWILVGLLMAGLLVAPSTALAHRVFVYAYVEGDQLKGEGYFGGGGKALHCPVQVFDAGGKQIGEAETNEEGNFTMALPKGQPPLKVVLNAGDGHRAEYEMTAEELGEGAEAAAEQPAPAQAEPAAGAAAPAATAASGASLAEIEKVVSKVVAAQVNPLKAQMVRLAKKDEVTLRDIIGGLGWILGLAGLFAWGRSRRN
jgi:nickel transport protein